MAMADGPKIARPILVRGNFLHKIDPKFFCILNSKWSKKFNQSIFSRLAVMGLTKTARHMGR